MEPLESKYKEILTNAGIAGEIASVDLSVPSDLIGEHFLSLCQFVVVKFKGEENDCHLFAKRILPSSAGSNQRRRFERFMAKEGFFLTKFLTQIKEFCIKRAGDDSGLQADTIFPKCCYADNEVILMENLATQGYKMVDKSEKQDFQHAKLVLGSLAVFHGVTHGLILGNGGRDGMLEEYPLLASMGSEPGVESMWASILGPPFDMLLGLLKESLVEGGTEAYASLTKYQGKFHSEITEPLKRASILPVVNHGDFWNNNMMFCYDEGLRVKFYDLQATRIGSGLADISNFLFTSVKAEVRKQWKELLRIYFEKFKDTVERLCFPLSASFEDFVNEFRTVSKHGLFLGLFGVIETEAMTAMKPEDFLGTQFPELFRTWISEHKDKVNGIVRSTVSLLKDYEAIGTI